MKKNIVFAFICLTLISKAQTIIWSEGFETDGEGSRYTSNHYKQSSPTCDFFERMSSSPLDVCFQNNFFTGFQGNYFWGSEDIMSSPGNRPAGYIQSTNINISGYNNLSFSLYLATGNNNGTRWESADSINIQVSIDGGSYKTVGRFMGSASLGGDLINDLNLNGAFDVGETVVSINAFTKYTFSIPYTGTSMTIKIDCDQVGGSEELGLDEFELKGFFSGAPEINVQGNSTTITDGDATPSVVDHTDFGSKSVCSGTVVRTFTIQNTGTASLTVSSVSISGPHASDFTITTFPAPNLSANTSTTFQVTFNPSDSGTRSATVTVANTDGDESNYDFAIQGTGTQITASITAQTDVTCNGSPTGSLTVTQSNGTANFNYSWSNGTSTNNTSSSTNTINALAAGTYTVTVTDNSSCTATASATITQPSVISTSTSITHVLCNGNSTGAINLTVSGGAGGYSFNWGSGINSEDLTNIAAGTYTVTIMDANNCTKTTSAMVTQPGALSVNLSGTTPICAGNSTSLNASVSGGSGAVSYKWLPGNLSGASHTIALGANTTFSVTVTDANNCTATSTIPITVNSLPVVSITGANSFCTGDSVLLTGNSGGTSQWYKNGVIIPAAINSTYYAKAPGVYNMRQTDANTCNDTAASGKPIIENALPIISVSSSPSNPIVCSGEQVTLSASGALSYSWSSGVTNNTAFSPSSSGTYTVIGTDNNDCSSTTTIAVVVNPLPSVSVNVVPTNATVCLGDSLVLNGVGASSYFWSNSIIDGTYFTPTSSGTYTVTGTDANGCKDTAAQAIVVNILPTITITYSDDTICTGAQVVLTANGAANYSWSGTVIDGIAFTPASTNTYTVTGTDANGCSSIATQNITVHPLPSVSVGFALASYTVCASQSSVSVSGNPNGGIFSNNVTGNVFDPSTSPLGWNVISYAFTDTLGCSNSASDSLFVDLCTSSQSLSKLGENSISVFPNPGNGEFVLNAKTAGTIQIYNAIGDVVLQQQILNSQTTIRLQNQPTGIYNLVYTEMDSPQNRFIIKIIIN